MIGSLVPSTRLYNNPPTWAVGKRGSARSAALTLAPRLTSGRSFLLASNCQDIRQDIQASGAEGPRRPERSRRYRRLSIPANVSRCVFVFNSGCLLSTASLKAGQSLPSSDGIPMPLMTRITLMAPSHSRRHGTAASFVSPQVNSVGPRTCAPPLCLYIFRY